MSALLPPNYIQNSSNLYFSRGKRNLFPGLMTDISPASYFLHSNKNQELQISQDVRLDSVLQRSELTETLNTETQTCDDRAGWILHKTSAAA